MRYVVVNTYPAVDCYTCKNVVGILMKVKSTSIGDNFQMIVLDVIILMHT